MIKVKLVRMLRIMIIQYIGNDDKVINNNAHNDNDEDNQNHMGNSHRINVLK